MVRTRKGKTARALTTPNGDVVLPAETKTLTSGNLIRSEKDVVVRSRKNQAPAVEKAAAKVNDEGFVVRRRQR